MSDLQNEGRSASNAFSAMVIAAVALGGVSLIWCITLQMHLNTAQKNLAVAQQENAALKQKLMSTDAHLRAATETLGKSLGMTQKQLETRAEAIMARQQMDTARLEKTQQATQQKIGQVSNDVSTVRTDVGGVKTDVTNTRNDLEATKGQLQRVMGDAGVMSGLIAKNHDELEILKHKGDRNYYEFTLKKGEKPVVLSTVKLQLKKADQKHARYTMVVTSDDREIEKKDKNLMEPVQFYTGKNPVLYEIVVNVVEKNLVSGYLSTPKGM
ncbi:MAG: hypothetical protein JSS87_04045 [Acidobacteria bacterium]|nr:hypothetical protein [Acidobacteriota bacterium]